MSEGRNEVRTEVRLRRVAVRAEGPVGVERLAAECGLTETAVRRLVAAGLIEPAGGAPDAPAFAPDAPALLARAVRLQRDLALGWAGALMASELLARIEELEERLRRYEPPG
ncbi:MAG: chaperone modulator CbpM [Thermoleophilia bacterium]|nr:chaperone modulator CbpM [Thermoleophilia bacterium]